MPKLNTHTLSKRLLLMITAISNQHTVVVHVWVQASHASLSYLKLFPPHKKAALNKMTDSQFFQGVWQLLILKWLSVIWDKSSSLGLGASHAALLFVCLSMLRLRLCDQSFFNVRVGTLENVYSSSCVALTGIISDQCTVCVHCYLLRTLSSEQKHLGRCNSADLRFIRQG